MTCVQDWIDVLKTKDPNEELALMYWDRLMLDAAFPDHGLTDEQVEVVFTRAEDRHDSESGINYYLIEAIMEDVREDI